MKLQKSAKPVDSSKADAVASGGLLHTQVQDPEVPIRTKALVRVE